MTPKPNHHNFVHCDVFATKPYSGNSLAVFLDSTDLSADQMLTITQELRHFESIFLHSENGQISARVFDQFEELPFAGHPIIGAACALHRQSGTDKHLMWDIALQGGRNVRVATQFENGRFTGMLDQGKPDFVRVVDPKEKPRMAQAYHLDAIADLPLEVISTGLKYLVIPTLGGLANARITIANLDEILASYGAEFAYVFDVERFEGRHWNNDGVMEDIATGSAAGVIGAYALKHGLVPANQSFALKQGHFVGRPSEIIVTPFGTSVDIDRVTVAGQVAFVGQGQVIAP